VLTPIFHAWERRLASVSTDRVVRAFEWGADWLPSNGHPPGLSEEERLQAHVRQVLADTDAYFTPTPTDDYELRAGGGDEPAALRFPSARITPHPENNTVYARYFPGRPRRGSGPRRAVLLLPQWNADAGGHIGLARLLSRFGISALRLSLPYHDRRMPSGLTRADFIVSANVGRTLDACRQAVLDARRAVWWLARQGYDRIGILGTSLGSCLSMLTSAHEPLIQAQALNHVSPFFADVVWRGLSTAHVRQGLEGAIDIDRLRALWMPISPQFHVERMRRTRTLLVYARYDLTFPVDLSRQLIAELQRRAIPHETAVLPCGHYSTGVAPFKFLDGYWLTRFLLRAL
jgi:dienelactone hydrolase